MPALVLEGGTFRPIFSCGVMDALLAHGVHFPYVIGVSAGITDGVSYVSRQPGRNLEVLMTYRHDKRYLGLRNYLTDRSMFGLKFVFERIPNELVPFDRQTYLESPTQVVVGVTDAATGEMAYLDGKRLGPGNSLLKATCALPLVFPPITVEGRQYYDGGLCDSIPVAKAQQDGHRKMLVVLTQPEGFRKKQKPSNRAAARLLRRKYPQLVQPLLNRHKMYNDQLDRIALLEASGTAVVLRPGAEVSIDSFEKDMDKIEALYRYGYALAESRMDEIKALFSEP